MKIIKYGLAFANDIEKFVDSVNAMIEKGWQPYGNYYEDALGASTQAMVKYAEFNPVKFYNNLSGVGYSTDMAIDINKGLQKENNELKLQIKHLNARNLSIEKENEDMKYQVSKSEALLTKEVGQLKKENEELKIALNNSHYSLMSAQACLDRLRIENEDMKFRLGSLEK